MTPFLESFASVPNNNGGGGSNSSDGEDDDDAVGLLLPPPPLPPSSSSSFAMAAAAITIPLSPPPFLSLPRPALEEANADFDLDMEEFQAIMNEDLNDLLVPIDSLYLRIQNLVHEIILIDAQYILAAPDNWAQITGCIDDASYNEDYGIRYSLEGNPGDIPLMDYNTVSADNGQSIGESGLKEGLSISHRAEEVDQNSDASVDSERPNLKDECVLASDWDKKTLGRMKWPLMNSTTEDELHDSKRFKLNSTSNPFRQDMHDQKKHIPQSVVDLTDTDSEGETCDLEVIDDKHKLLSSKNMDAGCINLINKSLLHLDSIAGNSQMSTMLHDAKLLPSALLSLARHQSGKREGWPLSLPSVSQGLSRSRILPGFGQSMFTSANSSKPPLPYPPPTSLVQSHKLNGETNFRGVLTSLESTTTSMLREEPCLENELSVPLLKHQRMALAWMEAKEKGAICAGGILADDQGLGKTVSTISLILKVKPLNAKPSDLQIEAQGEATTVNLDDDETESSHDNDSTLGEEKSCVSNVSGIKLSGGRPSGGTLVVCPTAVLRQWGQELKDKVTESAKLAVLVYHGSNRTKDPLELARFDVVLTTYAIVSMEVPKQPLAEERQSDERNAVEYGLGALMSNSNVRNTKEAEASKKKKGKGKGSNSDALDQNAGPLAKVLWFRVVLDEAQCIKNRRTQVARACWSLRAKRRWCLSGTPIQNAVDDLYSYFRFLKYDPYAAYKSFRAEIKDPIARDPSGGYKKLQGILQKIMLRRTKASTIDGEPIINLPKKNIQMKQIEFTSDEREFYNHLEVQSRNQFQSYAASGTIQRNYVNILWMLLRLRQACDHPRLVKEAVSEADQKPWLENAKKLSESKRTSLLAALESNLAMCNICMDAPEEAVISECEHVFCLQCISERLNHSDDACCPSPNCQKILRTTSVHSLSALKSCTDMNLGVAMQTSTNDSSLFSKDEVPNCSSKIMAVIETLRALPEDLKQMPGNFANLGRSVNGKSLESEANSTAKQSFSTQKAIVFSQWTSMLDLLETSLKKEGFCYRRLDGTMSVAARDRAVSDFKSHPEVTVMIMSLKAANLGLNLVAASHVLLIDVWWNPTTEDQAIDRAHRIGQTREVHVSRFAVKNTIEDRILALQERKRQIVASAFGEDVTGGQATRLSFDDMRYLFRA